MLLVLLLAHVVTCGAPKVACMCLADVAHIHQGFCTPPVLGRHLQQLLRSWSKRDALMGVLQEAAAQLSGGMGLAGALCGKADKVLADGAAMLESLLG